MTTMTEGTVDFKDLAVAAHSSSHREDTRQLLWRLQQG